MPLRHRLCCTQHVLVTVLNYVSLATCSLMSVVVNFAVRLGGCFNVACSWAPMTNVVTHPVDMCAGAVVDLMLSLRWQSTNILKLHDMRMVRCGNRVCTCFWCGVHTNCTSDGHGQHVCKTEYSLCRGGLGICIGNIRALVCKIHHFLSQPVHELGWCWW